MINYTTPTISLTVEGVDLSGMNVYVSLKQGKTELTKTGDDLITNPVVGDESTDTSIVFTLTQEESASFAYGSAVAVQVNWISRDGVRDATEMAKIGVMSNLLDEVIEYGG